MLSTNIQHAVQSLPHTFLFKQHTPTPTPSSPSPVSSQDTVSCTSPTYCPPLALKPSQVYLPIQTGYSESASVIPATTNTQVNICNRQHLSSTNHELNCTTGTAASNLISIPLNVSHPALRKIGWEKWIRHFSVSLSSKTFVINKLISEHLNVPSML